MIAYKLFRKRKDNSLGSLFINRKQKLYLDIWYKAENHPTKGYKERYGWHCCGEPKAPHLSMKDRYWYKVEIEDYQGLKRPLSQGGLWYIANEMRIIEKIS